MNKILDVKRKREFSCLPDSVVSRALEVSRGDVKEARRLLRKYFGVFLTNRVLKGKDEGVLEYHFSSKKRDYGELYSKIFEGLGDFNSVVDLGCGVNGFSIREILKNSKIKQYWGVEASGQIVDSLNEFFKGVREVEAEAFCFDLFDLDRVRRVLRGAKIPRIVFMFQLVDALENMKRNFSRELLIEVAKNCESIVLTLSTESIGGKKKFVVKRKWMVDFLRANFNILKDFEISGERVIVFEGK